jgi:hypothetical protein
MAFSLPINNMTGIAVIDQPAGVLASQANFIQLYDYVTQYQPDLIPELHYRNGLGKITDFLRINGKESSYSSDQVIHQEQGRLHNIIKNATVVGSTFTSPTPHQLRVGEVVKITDASGVMAQGRVSSITSPTVVVLTNDGVGAFAFTGVVDMMPLSSRHKKGSLPFAQGMNWNPTPYINYSQIIKETYDVNESDMAHTTWVNTPFGPKWFNMEMTNTGNKFDNIVEMTQILHQRAAATSATATAGEELGMKGVVQQIEERGNVSHDYIQTVADLDKIAYRLKQQGSCREVTIWGDHQQSIYFSDIAASQNAGYAGGRFYGSFMNSADMAIKLGFTTIERSGVTFHFTAWKLLDDPSLLGSAKFLTSAPGYIVIPSGMTDVMENGMTDKKGYISLRYRRDGIVDRKRKVEIFGLGGTAQKEDKMSAYFLTECTNQVIGANQFFVGSRNASNYI